MSGDPPICTCNCGPYHSIIPSSPCPAHSPPTYWPAAPAPWTCPRCGAMNAPHSAQCTCAPEALTIGMAAARHG